MMQIKKILGMLKKINYVLDKKQKKKSFFTFLAILIGTLLELLGVSIIIPFLYAMLTPEKLYEKWYIRVILQVCNVTTEIEMFLVLGGLVALIYIIKSIVTLQIVYIQNSYSTTIQKELSTQILSSYMKRPYVYFRKINSAEVIRAIQSDISGVHTIINDFFELATQLLITCVITFLLFYTDFKMAVGMLLCALICLFVIILGFRNVMNKMGLELREANLLTNKFAFEAIGGIKEITVCQRRDTFVKQYEKAAEKRKKASLMQAFVAACPDKIIEAVCVSGFILVVCIRIISGVNIQEFISNIAVFAVAAFKILPCISRIASKTNELIFLSSTLDATYKNMKIAKEFEVIARTKKTETEDNIGKFRSLEIKNISWKYEDGIGKVLDNLSITVNRGDALALIGPSGAGKTTLADIILGLFEPQEGTVEINGKNIFEIKEQWSKYIGYVPQSVYLIDDTIRNNIAFGILPEDISDEKIWIALEQAQLREYVEKLPLKLDTIVGERGVKFSGGQKQRIAIARALYMDPEILVLDEATSALDNDTEKAVMQSIDELQGKKTLIIIAHRLSTIMKCNLIYEINNQKGIRRNQSEIKKIINENKK